MDSLVSIDVEVLNVRLREFFGIDTESTRPIWRVVWANDQYEKRLSDCTPAGIQLLYPELQELPKYQDKRDRWVLERLVIVPDFQQFELGGLKTSYEPIWTFNDRHGNYQDPKWEACYFLVNLVYAAMGKAPMPRYIDPDSVEPLEKQRQRIDQLVEELFGDESDLMLRTVTGEAVINKYEKEKVE